MINKISRYLSSALIVLAIGSCQKMDKPALGDYPTDGNQVLLAGPLRFYSGFNITDGASPRWNAADSISSNPASLFPLSYEAGISGNGIKGKDNNAIMYLNANDMKNATSMTIAFWFKRAVNTNTEFFFSLRDTRPPYSGWNYTSMFMMAEHGTPTAATVKFYLLDQWLEFPDASKLQKPFFDGNWHHWAMVYDETTSKMTYYFDGQLVTGAPASATDVKKNGAPRGPLDLTGAAELIIGGSSKHVGLKGAGDDWIKSFQGSMDQFRMYNKALTAAEIQALFASKL